MQQLHGNGLGRAQLAALLGHFAWRRREQTDGDALGVGIQAGDRAAKRQRLIADWPMWEMVTTDFVYVRLHGHELTYASGYSEATLRDWASKLRRWMDEKREVHVYFDNDAFGHAPANPLRLIALVSTDADG